MTKKRGIKRKKLMSDNGKLSRKEVKFLEDFGEEHPINDKLDNLEDRFVKRVYDENEEEENSEIKKDNIKEEQIIEELEPDYYEELLNVFGEKKDIVPESDESDMEEIQNNHSKNDVAQQIEYESEDILDDEEQSNTEINNQNYIDKDLKSNDLDNFSEHFFAHFESFDIDALKNSKQIITPYKWPQLGSFVESRTELEKFNLIKVDQPAKNLDQIQLKPMLKENIPKSMMLTTQNKYRNMTSFQLELLSLLTTYKDLYYSERTFENADEIRLVYATHALNHILKTRSRILSHNSKIKDLHDINKEYRDQGLTRPKVLIVLPFRESAFQTVNCMINLLFGDSKDSEEKKIHLMNYKRFCKEFGHHEDDYQISSRRPDDYKKLFAGNIDDSFRLGISLTKKSLKLYSDFYSSDIIIASPLGLRLIIGAPGEKERDFDFLSSIEMVIFDQADVFLMQNWEHVLHIVSHLHLKPKETHGVDFSRVKLWVLELWSRFYYQLIVFASISSSMISGFFNKHSNNFSGKLFFRNPIPRSRAAINNVYIQCPQIFHRFDCDSFASSSDSRFNFFIKKILPKFRDPMMVRTMIFIPSYFDFVRLRNYFRKEDLSFSQICEYTKPGKVAKARHIFFYGGRHFLLYTERFHYFHRYSIKGIRHLIFYEPPLYPNFYSEMINSMNQANQGKKMLTDYSSMSVTMLYNKFDLHSLIGLVGTSNSTLLLNKLENNVHMFLTENVRGK